MVQDITKSTYDMVVLKNTTKGTNNENTQINNLQKTAEIKLKIPVPYRTQLVQNTTKIMIPFR